MRWTNENVTDSKSKRSIQFRDDDQKIQMKEQLKTDESSFAQGDRGRDRERERERGGLNKSECWMVCFLITVISWVDKKWDYNLKQQTCRSYQIWNHSAYIPWDMRCRNDNPLRMISTIVECYEAIKNVALKYLSHSSIHIYFISFAASLFFFRKWNCDVSEKLFFFSSVQNWM